MKKTLTVLLLCLGLVNALAQSDQVLIDSAHQIMLDYQELMSGDPNLGYVKAWQNFVRMRDAGKFTVRIRSVPCESLLKAVSFTVDWDTGEAWLSVNRVVLQMYGENKSVVYSMITHELWHAFAYAQNPKEFKTYTSDEFEEAMFEGDAYYVEGQFIDSVLVPRGIVISRFEKYLLDCFRADSMNSFTAAFRGEDFGVIKNLYDLRQRRLEGTIDQDTVYDRSTEIGKTVFSEYDKHKEDRGSFAAYMATVSIYTFNRYVQLLANQTDKVRTSWGQIMNDYPILWSMLRTIPDIAKESQEAVDEYHRKVLSVLDLPVK